jgi:DNA-directed RNA polymerase subunit H (RpoH/RPB5)
MKREEVEKLISQLNISLAQLPKIKITDTALPEGCEIEDVIKIEREEINEEGEKKIYVYYRVVSV